MRFNSAFRWFVSKKPEAQAETVECTMTRCRKPKRRSRLSRLGAQDEDVSESCRRNRGLFGFAVRGAA